jgi:Fur family transcriptional regulator, ferric uptake regulator
MVSDTGIGRAIGADATTSLADAMDAAGYRLTEPRRVVAELIAAREGHFTAADLIEDARVRSLGIGRATIFRVLDLLTELEVLERVGLPSGEHAYVPCRPRRHHHHIICERCGRVADVGDQGLVTAMEDIERRTGWRIGAHRLELYGRCPHCRDLPPS